MLRHTKKHHIEESVCFIGTPAAIKRLREFASTTGAVEAKDTIPASEITPELDSNSGGLYLKGIRYRDDVTQEELSRRTGIPRRHLSEMENGKRPIGKESAKKLAAALHCDYRRFL